MPRVILGRTNDLRKHAQYSTQVENYNRAIAMAHQSVLFLASVPKYGLPAEGLRWNVPTTMPPLLPDTDKNATPSFSFR